MVEGRTFVGAALFWFANRRSQRAKYDQKNYPVFTRKRSGGVQAPKPNHETLNTRRVSDAESATDRLQRMD